MALSVCENIAARVVKTGGAALLIDYGEDFVQEDSLRAFKKHKQVHALSEVKHTTVLLLTTSIEYAVDFATIE
jgi:SAM-dependent MidA family methyltransferase